MIASLTGTVASRGADNIVLQVGGVGLAVLTTAATTATATTGTTLTLVTSLVVREDSLTLYGFATTRERETFELLQTVTGFGPRLALTVLSSISVDQLHTAIATEDLAALTSVSGIGRKGAQRLVMDLKDKIGPVTADLTASSPAVGWRGPVKQALTGLGWAPADADGAISFIASEPGAENLSVAEALRRTLQTLDRREART